MNEMYTTQEVAKMTKSHVVTIRRYIDEGKLKAVKIGKKFLIEKNDLQTFIDSYKKESRGA